jgi:hypothetical protein
MSTSNWCDKAKAVVKIDQTCGITNSLRQLSNSLPVHSENLDQAVVNIGTAINAGNTAEIEVNNAILGTLQGIQATSWGAVRMANWPFETARREILSLGQDIRNTAMSAVGVMNMMNCISSTLSGKTIPGTQAVKNCLGASADRVGAILNDVQKTINQWQKAINDGIQKTIDTVDDKLSDILQEFEDDNSIVACASSMINIPDDIVGSMGASIGTHNESLGNFGTTLAGCAGRARDLATTLEKAGEDLQKVLDEIDRVNGLVGDHVNKANDLIQGFKDAGQGTLVEKVKESIAPVVQPATNPAEPLTAITPISPATSIAVSNAKVAVMQAADVVAQVAAVAESISVDFVFGHEILLDRVNNIIRIKHKDGHYSLYNSSNIIHAADVTYKHLAWTENLIEKFNSHTHPGVAPGAANTAPPTTQFTMSDGTTITLAG